MTMPEAAMDQYHGIEPRENNVRFAGEVCTAQAITVAEGMECFAHGDLWPRVRGAYQRHSSAAFLF